LDVVAPGVNILSTTLNGNYDSDSGTSFAAPQVSAIAALILSQDPNQTWEEVRFRIRKTARKLPSYFTFVDPLGSIYGSRSNEVGFGLADAYFALCPVQYFVYFNLFNYNEHGVSDFQVEIMTEGGSPVYNEYIVLNSNDTYSAQYDLLPGDYTISAFANGGVWQYYDFTVVKGGQLSFTFLGSPYTTSYWGNPTYVSYN
jgi:subtilisin family serine protease